MLLWVLETNPSRGFYEKIGGRLLPDKKIYELSGRQFPEVAYGFELACLMEELAIRGIGRK